MREQNFVLIVHCSYYVTDLDCIDDTSVSWTVNDVQLKCKEYVKKNPARCYNTYVKTTCCKSCEGRCCFFVRKTCV